MSLPFDHLREGAAGCPSDLALDQWAAGELESAPRATVDAHVAGCATCQARVATRKQGWAAFPQVDERKLLAGIRRGAEAAPPWWRRPWFAPLAAAISVSVVAVAVWRAQPSPDDGLRAKGGLHLRVFRAAADGSAEALESGAELRGGDRLRFVADFPAGGMAAVVGVEASGTLYTAWPAQGTSGPVKQGVGVELPGAVALDASAGEESLFLVLCPGRAEPFTCSSRGPGQAPSCGAGCASVAFVMRKP